MSSNINANNIDSTYPIAGVDNDSQGFRSNFTNIKNNLGHAKNEIEDLQGKVLLKSALTGTTLNNDLAGAEISGALVSDLRHKRIDFGTNSGTLAINYSDASNFTVSTNGNVSLSFTGFPAAGQVGEVTFEIQVTNTAHTLTFPSNVDKGVTGITGINPGLNRITFGTIGVRQFRFWTDDGGTSVHIDDLSRNRTVFESTEIKIQQRTPVNSGAAGDSPGMLAVDNNYAYICTGEYDGSTAIWKRAGFSAY